MANHLVQTATAGMGQVLANLSAIQEDVSEARALVNLMGWELPPGVEDIGLATLDLQEFLKKLDPVIGASDEEWNDELAMLGRIAELAPAVGSLAQQIRTLARELPVKLASFGDYVDRTNIHKELPKRLFDFLLANYIAQKSPLGYAILHLINVIDYPHFEADPAKFQIEHVRATMNWHLLNTLVSDPKQLAKEAYGWGTPQFLVMTFLQRVSYLFQVLGLRSRTQPLNRQAEESWLQRSVTEPDPMPQLNTFLHEERGTIGGVRLGLSIFGARPTSNGASDGGLGIVPIVQGEVTASIPFHRFDDTFIDLHAKGDVLKRLAMILRPDQDVKILTGQGLEEAVTGRLALGFRRGGPDSQPLILSLPGGTQFSVQQFSVIGGVEHRPPLPSTSFLELSLLGCRFDWSLRDADGFLQEGLSRKSIDAPFEFRIAWTSDKGIYIQGGGGLNVTFPLHLSRGPIELESLHLAANIKDEGFDIEVSTSGSLRLGPVRATVDRLGLLVNVSFNDGNLGLFGLSPRFKPPTGIGLAINGPGVAGGGFLFFDAAKAEYGGILQLEVAERIAVKAIGLLTTRLPDGTKGYSLVILLTAEGFTPIPLGFGFTLTGIGGLLGINRTVRTETLRQGLKTGTLNSILFPRDPLRNAPQLVSDLRAVFPPVPRRHVLGPMIQLRWGTPTLLTLDLAVLLELPSPVRLIVLGRLQVLLPDQRHPLVQVRMDALGVLDFNEGTVALDATLYDSRILEFTLTGDMALRARWGTQPTFVLAIGGLHPRFPAPAGLPALSRLALTLADGDSLQLRCQAYLALTSNTVQFGARVDLHAAGGNFSFDGMLGFDALVQLAPLAFRVDVAAALALRYRGHLLMGISFSGMLAGPTPWHVEGTATIKILFFKVSVHFERQFGAATAPPLPAAVDVLALVTEALRDRRNWSATLPRTEPAVVTLREATPAPETLRVHPLAELTVRERVVPLKRRITKLGTAPLRGGPTTVTVTATSRSATPQPVATTPVQEPFALAQFEDLRDDELLARPAFEAQEAGLAFTPDTVAFEEDPGLTTVLRYETLVIDPTRPPEEPKLDYFMPAAVLTRVAASGAAGQAVLRRHGRARYRVTELVA